MGNQLRYEKAGRIATIAMDDGKVNAMSSTMLAALHEAFDRAERDEAVVILTGRPKIFSAGFDLGVIRGSDLEALVGMLRGGAELALRILGFPTPVVSACTGHAPAMAAFLLLASDLRVGADGPFGIGLNEVAIGLTVPQFAIELARQRLTPAYYSRSLMTGERFAPEEAARAGYLDFVVAPERLQERARELAGQLSTIDLAAHAATKKRARRESLEAIRAAIDQELTLENAMRSIGVERA